MYHFFREILHFKESCNLIGQQYFDISILIIYHHAKNKKKAKDPFLRKMPNWRADRQTGRQAGRQADRDRQTEIDRPTNGQTDNDDFIGLSVKRGSNKTVISIRCETTDTGFWF